MGIYCENKYLQNQAVLLSEEIFDCTSICICQNNTDPKIYASSYASNNAFQIAKSAKFKDS